MIWANLPPRGESSPTDWDTYGTPPPPPTPNHSTLLADTDDGTGIVCQVFDRSEVDVLGCAASPVAVNELLTLTDIRIHGRVFLVNVVGANPRLYGRVETTIGALIAELSVVLTQTFDPIPFVLGTISGLSIAGPGGVNNLVVKLSCGEGGAGSTVIISKLMFDYTGEVDPQTNRLSGTYSELLGRTTSEIESFARAAGNERVAYSVDSYLASVSAAYADVETYTYHVQRLAHPDTITNGTYGWIAFAGAGAEAGFIHHAGVRRIIPSGVNAGYYVMNMGNAQYVAWQIDRAIKALEGTLFGLPGQHPGFVMDGVVVDLVLWYPAFDDDPTEPLETDPTENILTSDEYSGTGDAYQTACRLAFEATRAAVIAAYPESIAFPNFGALSFCASTDHNTQAVIQSSTVIEAQAALSYSNGEPNLNAQACVTAWATINALAGKELLAHGLLTNTPAQTQASKDRAKVGVAAWFQMCARAGLFARYATDTDAPEEITTWEQPDLLHLAISELGAALAVYEVVPNTWSVGTPLGTLYRRTFTNGESYLFVRNAGEVGTETAVITTDPRIPFIADGTFGPVATSLSLTLGEGALLLVAPIVSSGQGGGVSIRALSGQAGLRASSGLVSLRARPNHQSYFIEANKNISGHVHDIDIYRARLATKAIIFLHGGTGTKWHSAYQLGLKKNDNPTDYDITDPSILADNRVILVFPQGQHLTGFDIARTWSNRIMDSGVDDMAFLADLVAWIKSTYSVPKVYLAGHSMGGCMTNRVWHENWNLCDGYMAFAGPPGEYFLDNPYSFGSVKPYMGLNGSADSIIQTAIYYAQRWPIAGAVNSAIWINGAASKCAGERNYLQTRVTAKCTGTVHALEIDAVTTGNITKWSYCSGSIELLRVNGADHNVESIESVAGTTFLELMFDFIQRNP